MRTEIENTAKVQILNQKTDIVRILGVMQDKDEIVRNIQIDTELCNSIPLVMPILLVACVDGSRW